MQQEYTWDTAAIATPDTLLTTSAEVKSLSGVDTSELPGILKKIYEKMKDRRGEFDSDFFASIDIGLRDIDLKYVQFTVSNLRSVVLDTGDYQKAKDPYKTVISLQGYASIAILDRFWGSCLLIGREKEYYLSELADMLDLIKESEEDREKRKNQELEAVRMEPTYSPSPANDPINDAEHTNGIYIIADRNTQKATYEIVMQAMAFADIANNPAFGLALGVKADINTITNSMSFAVGGSVRLATQRYTLTGSLQLLNGKLNKIGISVDAELPIVPPAVFFTSAGVEVGGFQEPYTTIRFFGGVGIGKSLTIPEALSKISKYFWPNLSGTIRPVDLYVEASIDPGEDYYSFAAKGTFMAAFYVAGEVTYEKGDWDVCLKAGTTRNKYLNLSLTVGYEKRGTDYKVWGDFHGSFKIDWLGFIGITVQGGINMTLQGSCRYNYLPQIDLQREDLIITVDARAEIKIGFSIGFSVQKQWVVNTSYKFVRHNRDEKLLATGSDAGGLPEIPVGTVVACESEDIAENTNLPITVGRDAVAAKSWRIDEENGSSGIVKFQIASQYTLADSGWRLTHTSADGETITVYTADNAAGIVTEDKTFTHRYYELLVDTPEAGSWTLEVLGDKKNTGGIYMEALLDEKIHTSLEIVEQTRSEIKFKYSAFTRDSSDTTFIYLNVEEIAAPDNKTPFVGTIASLEETENGEFIWEIPEEYRNDCQYRFYISMSSVETALPQKSNTVVSETIIREEAELECSWQLVYSGDDTDTVTAVITITNNGFKKTAFQWELLDHTNKDSSHADEAASGATDTAAVLLSGSHHEIKGKSTLTFEKTLTVTDSLRNDLAGLQLTVTKLDGQLRNGEDAEDVYVDNANKTTFSAIDAHYSVDQTVTWDAVEGAASYVLQYALEGEWEDDSVYVRDITGTSCVLSVTPGEYAYRVIAMDAAGQAIGPWSEEEDVEFKFNNTQEIAVDAGFQRSRSDIFSLNDGIYDLNGSAQENFTGTLTLYRMDLVQVGKKGDTIQAREKETGILTMRFVNGKLSRPVKEQLLDNGDYFWEWKRSGRDTASDSGISLHLSGSVFSIEDKDRNSVAIGGKDSDLPVHSITGDNIETIEGEVGFSNADAIWNYGTSEGGELSLTIAAGTEFDAQVKLYIYVQNDTSGRFSCAKSLAVKAGTYETDTVILKDLVIKNNFYIKVASWDNGKGRYNTDYSFDLSFDAFQTFEQHTDVLEIDGESISEWVGYRSGTHRYLLQVEDDDLYTFTLNGDAGDAVLRICNIRGGVIKQMKIQSGGSARIDGLYLESGNYYVEVAALDNGKGKYNTGYDLSASKLSSIYPKLDTTNDTWKMAAEQEALAVGETVEAWLGIGDKADFFKIALDTADPAARLGIVLDEDALCAVEEGLLQFTCRSDTGRNLALTEREPGVLCVQPEISGYDEVFIGVSLRKPADNVDYSFTTIMLA